MKFSSQCSPRGSSRGSAPRHYRSLAIYGFGMAMMGMAIAVQGCSFLQSSGQGAAGWLPGAGGSGGRGLSSQRPSSPDRFGVDSGSNGGITMHDLAPQEIGTTLQAKLGGEDQDKAEALYREGQAIYDKAIELRENAESDKEARAKFLKAARRFRLASARWPDSALEQDALFMLGESRFFADQYVQANRIFERLVAQYPGTKHLDLVQSRRFTIAQYWLELARNQNDWDPGIRLYDEKRPAMDLAGSARRILHRIRLDDPTGKIADDATLALANAYFEAGKYEDAADAYEDLRRTYPGSPHQFHAHLFELKARLASYRGASYDGTQLEKADRIMKSLVTQFPDKIDEHREYLDEEAGRIRHLLAARDFEIAEYYEDRGANRAASIYYNSVAEKFPETGLAENAIAKKTELSDEPPVPKQRAAWLVNLFPEPRATKPLIAPGDKSIFR